MEVDFKYLEKIELEDEFIYVIDEKTEANLTGRRELVAFDPEDPENQYLLLGFDEMGEIHVKNQKYGIAIPKENRRGSADYEVEEARKMDV